MRTQPGGHPTKHWPCDPYMIWSSAQTAADLRKSIFCPKELREASDDDGSDGDGDGDGGAGVVMPWRPAPTLTDLATAFEANKSHRGLDAFFVTGQHNAWGSTLRRLGDVCRAARGEEALWSALASIPRGPYQRTSLMAAAFRGDAERVLFLLRCGASVTATDSTKEFSPPPDAERFVGMRGHFGTSMRTALHWAAESGSAACVAALTAAGADVHAVDVGSCEPKSRSAPLHITAFWGHVDAVRALLAAGADPNDSAVGADGVSSAWAARRRAAAAAWALELSEARKELVRVKNGGVFPTSEDLEDDDDDDNGSDANSGGGDFVGEEAFAPVADSAPVPPRWTRAERVIWQSRQSLHKCWSLNELEEKAALSPDDATRIQDFVRDATTTPLLAAIAGANAHDGEGGGHLDVIKALLSAGANPSAPFRDSMAEAPLIAAVRIQAPIKRAEIVQALLSAGARVNAPMGKCTQCAREHTSGVAITGSRTTQSPTALHIAAKRVDLPIVRLLIEGGADPNARNAFGATPLHAVAKSAPSAAYGLTDTSDPASSFGAVIRFLVENGADATAVDIRGATPLTTLSNSDSDGRMYERMREWSSESACAMYAAATRTLMGAGAHPLVTPPPNIAVNDDDNGGDDDDHDSQPPLVVACRSGLTCVVRAMLAHGVAAPPSLLLHLPWQNVRSGTFKCPSADCNPTAMVRLLVSAGANVNEKDGLGRPFLLNMLSSGVDVVRTLVECGVDTRATGVDGETALMLAAQLRDKELIGLLLESGADVRAAMADGTTALRVMFRSVQVSRLEYIPAAPIVQLLLDAGAVRTGAGGVDAACLEGMIAAVDAHIGELKARIAANERTAQARLAQPPPVGFFSSPAFALRDTEVVARCMPEALCDAEVARCMLVNAWN